MVTRILPIRIRAPLFSGFFRPTVAPEVVGAQRRGAQQEEPHNRRGSEREETTPNRGRGGSRLGAGDSRDSGWREKEQGGTRAEEFLSFMFSTVGWISLWGSAARHPLFQPLPCLRPPRDLFLQCWIESKTEF